MCLGNNQNQQRGTLSKTNFTPYLFVNMKLRQGCENHAIAIFCCDVLSVFMSLCARVATVTLIFNRPQQVKCFKAIYCGKDINCAFVLPRGYSKWLIFHLLPALTCGKFNNEGSSSPPVCCCCYCLTSQCINQELTKKGT